MIDQQAVRTRNNSRIWEIVYIGTVSMVSAPAWLTGMSLLAWHVWSAAARAYGSPSESLSMILSCGIFFLPWLGVITLPVAILLVIVGSFCRVRLKTKLLCWAIVLIGIAGWYACWVKIIQPYAGGRF